MLSRFSLSTNGGTNIRPRILNGVQVLLHMSVEANESNPECFSRRIATMTREFDTPWAQYLWVSHYTMSE